MAGAAGNNQPLGVYRSNNCASAWYLLGMPGSQVLDVARGTAATWYAATYGQGAYRSTDDGATWRTVNEGLDDDRVYAIAVQPTNPSILLLSTHDHGVYRSTDAGTSWERRPAGDVDETNTVTFDPSDGNIAFLGTYAQGLYRSQDGGLRFQASNQGLTNPAIWRITSAPSDPNRVYVGSSGGVFRSTDRGVTWQSAGLANEEIRALAVHPQIAGWLYAGARSGGIWLTTDGGNNWRSITANLTSAGSVYSLLFDPTRCNFLLAGAATGIYRYAFGLPNTPTPTPTSTPTPMPILIRGTSTPTRTATRTPTLTWTPTPTPTPAPDWLTLVNQTFESTFPGNWQVLDNNGAAYGEYYWGRRACRPYAGGYSGWAIGAGADGSALSCGANYSDRTDSWMVYGPFSLQGATAADLRFKLWLNSEMNYDYVYRLASIDGYNFYGSGVSGNTGGWIDQTLDLANVYGLGSLLGHSQVWVAIEFYTDYSVTYSEGAYVDNVVLRKCIRPTCSGVLADLQAPPGSQLVTRDGVEKRRSDH